MNHYIENFIQHGGQVDSFLASGVLWIGFAAIGFFLVSRDRVLETAPFYGWAIINILYTVLGVFTNIPFMYFAIGTGIIALAGVIYAYRTNDRFLAPGMIKMVVLAAPLLLLVSAMMGSQWDEFSDWLITPRFLLQTDAFPNKDNAHLSGSLAAYPFGWHYITYLASALAGRFLENAGALVNVFILLTFGLLTVRLIRMGLEENDTDSSPGWGLCALGALSATLLSTTFAQKVALTSYADVATAALCAFGGVIGWFMLGALAEGRLKDARTNALQVGLLMMLLVNLKQSTVALFLIVVSALILAGLRDPAIKVRNLVRLLPYLVIPSIIIFAVWRYYILTDLPAKEMRMTPYEDWLIAYIPQILMKMLSVLSKKGAYLVMMGIVVAMGIRGLVRFRTPLDRLAVIAAAIFLGHNLFLLFAYVSTFGKFDALRAASFWRYNMQVGLMGVAFMAYAMAVLWKTRFQGQYNIQKLAWLPIIILLAAPFIAADKLRFDRHPWVPHFRMVGQSMNDILGPEHGLMVLDPKGSGESGVITRYEMGGTGIFRGYIGLFQKPTEKTYSSVFRGGAYSHVLIHSLDTNLLQVLGLELDDETSFLLEKDADQNWHILRSWKKT